MTMHAGGYQLSGGAGGAATSGDATGGNAAFDSSGWVVNFGSGSVESSRNDALGQYVPYIVAGVAVLLAWRFLGRRK